MKCKICQEWPYTIFAQDGFKPADSNSAPLSRIQSLTCLHPWDIIASVIKRQLFVSCLKAKSTAGEVLQQELEASQGQAAILAQQLEAKTCDLDKVSKELTQLKHGLSVANLKNSQLESKVCQVIGLWLGHAHPVFGLRPVCS